MKHQNISFILVVKQRLSEPLTDVGGGGCTLEVHGGKFGERVLIQVIVVFFRKICLHGELIDVDLLCDHPLKFLQTESNVQ